MSNFEFEKYCTLIISLREKDTICKYFWKEKNRFFLKKKESNWPKIYNISVFGIFFLILYYGSIHGIKKNEDTRKINYD